MKRSFKIYFIGLLLFIFGSYMCYGEWIFYFLNNQQSYDIGQLLQFLGVSTILFSIVLTATSSRYSHDDVIKLKDEIRGLKKDIDMYKIAMAAMEEENSKLRAKNLSLHGNLAQLSQRYSSLKSQK